MRVRDKKEVMTRTKLHFDEVRRVKRHIMLFGGATTVRMTPLTFELPRFSMKYGMSSVTWGWSSFGLLGKSYIMS